MNTLPEKESIADKENLAGPKKALRIVHAANLQMDKDGKRFFDQDQKIQHGLIRLGHFVYTFSINDRARMLSPTGGKDFGKGRANRALIETCRNVEPDVLLLGHAQYISAETLGKIRSLLPKIRIGLWYIDPLWDKKKTQHLYGRLKALDAVCCSGGGPLLESLATNSCAAGFIPSASDAGIERLRAFETPEKEMIHDLLFYGNDKKFPQRRQFLMNLKEKLPGLRLGLYGCLGNPAIFGARKEELILRSKMAPNLSRRFDVPLYSSAKIIELMGNGILVLNPRGAGLEELYAEGEVVYFDGIDDLAVKIKELSADRNARIKIARKGWLRVHRDYHGKRIAEFILALTMRDPGWRNYPWAKHVFIKN